MVHDLCMHERGGERQQHVHPQQPTSIGLPPKREDIIIPVGRLSRNPTLPSASCWISSTTDCHSRSSPRATGSRGVASSSPPLSGTGVACTQCSSDASLGVCSLMSARFCSHTRRVDCCSVAARHARVRAGGG